MEPLKVTFTFSAPVFIDSEYPIHLDALVAASVCREWQSSGEDAWKMADDLSAYLDRSSGDDWVWMASKLVFTQASGIMFQNMIRKSDPARYFEDLGRHWEGLHVSEAKPLGIKPETFAINTGSGQQRGYQWLSASQWMEKAEAWAVGDKDALLDCLSKLEFVGKVGRNGYGRIKSITVEDAPVGEVENWRLRVLPSDEIGLAGVQYKPVDSCLRAPYWKKLNRVIAKEPLM